eukprot:363543_1
MNVLLIILIFIRTYKAQTYAPGDFWIHPLENDYNMISTGSSWCVLQCPDGCWCTRIQGNQYTYIETARSTLGYHHITLEFSMYIEGLNLNEHCKVYYSIDNTINWVILAAYNTQYTNLRKTIELPVDASNNTGIRILFYVNGDDISDDCYIQNGYLYGTPITSSPTPNPTISPTPKPTVIPTNNPIKYPTISPTNHPSYHPATNQPTTSKPTTAPIRPGDPTKAPTYPTAQPTYNPSNTPTFNPTISPTMKPTDNPTKSPSYYPTKSPTEKPTLRPTKSPLTPHPTLILPPLIPPTLAPITTSTMFLSMFSTGTDTGNKEIVGNVNIMIGIIIGVVLLLIVFIVLIIFYIKKKSEMGSVSSVSVSVNEVEMNSNQTLTSGETKNDPNVVSDTENAMGETDTDDDELYVNHGGDALTPSGNQAYLTQGDNQKQQIADFGNEKNNENDHEEDDEYNDDNLEEMYSANLSKPATLK